MTSPNGAVPDKAYVSGGSGQSGLSDLNDLTEGVAKSRMRAPLANSFSNQVNGFWGAVSGLVGAVVGGVTAVVNGIVGVINSIAGLFTATRVDMGKVDKARVDAENAIVENMSSSLEMLDEIQRFGGAYMDYPTYTYTNGEENTAVTPLNMQLPLAAGTSFTPPVSPLNHPPNFNYPQGSSATSQSDFARGSGHLNLNESGLWLVFFQAAVLQGSAYVNTPADLVAIVTPSTSPLYPNEYPGIDGPGNPIGNNILALHRSTGAQVTVPTDGFVLTYGRASSFVRTNTSKYGGGNTIFGVLPAYLPAAGWKVTLMGTAWRRFGGPASTNVIAYKVNSESIRESIDDLTEQIELALPGASTQLDLDEASIQAMVSEAQNVEVDIDYNGD